MTGRKKMVPLPPNLPNNRALIFVKELLEASKVVAVIDRYYSVSDLPEALRYLKKGHARGKNHCDLKGCTDPITNHLNNTLGV